MIQTQDIQHAEDTETTVIDFEAAAAKITTDRIAAALLHIASNENVRVSRLWRRRLSTHCNQEPKQSTRSSSAKHASYATLVLSPRMKQQRRQRFGALRDAR